MTLDTVPLPAPVPAERVVMDRRAADEPVAAERETVRPAEPNTVSVGPRTRP
jgi:hypothetical protein